MTVIDHIKAHEVVTLIHEIVGDDPQSTPADKVLRRYTMAMRLVTEVDNQGDACEFCTTDPIAVNTYLYDMEGGRHCVDHCVRCLVYVLEVAYDTNMDIPVTIEIAQGADLVPTR